MHIVHASQADWAAEIGALGCDEEVGDPECEDSPEPDGIADPPEGPVDELVAAVHDEELEDDLSAELQLAQQALQLPEDSLVGASYQAACYFARDKLHMSNLSAESSKLGIDRKELRKERLYSAGLLSQLEQQAWASVERNVMAQKGKPGVRLRCYIEAFMFDGVDMSVATRRRSDLGTMTDLPLDPAMEPEERLALISELSDHLATLPDGKELGPAKLLNTQHGASMLLSINGSHHVLQGDRITWLQVLDRNTGETLRHALERICMTSIEARDAFERTIRLAMSDSAGYNLRAEKHAREPGVSKIHLLCDAHIVAGIHQKVNSLLSRGIDGMVKASLSLQGGGTISVFRKAMRRVLTRNLVLIREEPPAEAKAYKKAMLDLFLGDSVQNAQLRATISRCASGDWRAKGRFEYLVTGEETRVEVLKKLFEFFVPALVGHQPRTYPQHRWTGADLALQDHGMLCLIHGLFESTYVEFLQAFGGVEGAPQPDEDMEGEDDALRVHGGGAAAGQEDLRTRDAKRHHRGAALQWARGPHRDRDLVVTRTVLEPMHQYMVQEIAASAALSLTKATHRRLEAMLAVGDLRGFLDSARWPLLEAALGSKDLTCLSKLSDLDDPACYSAWPEEWWTVETRTLLFRCLSRQAAAVHELLVKKHQACPYSVFLLVADPVSAEARLEGTCMSARDEYTAGFLETYKDDLGSQPALLELAMILLQARTSTVSLESSNASLRRRLHGASLQVHMPDLHSISAEFALGKLRRRQIENKFPPGHREHRGNRKTKRSEGQQKRKRRSSGGGGMQRAFLHSKGQNISKELAAEYRALTPEAKAALLPQARISTARAALGLGGFSTKGRV